LTQITGTPVTYNREATLVVFESNPMPEFGRPEPLITRVKFQDDGGGTRMTLSRPYPAASRGTAQAGWSNSLDKLKALLPEAAEKGR